MSIVAPASTHVMPLLYVAGQTATPAIDLTHAIGGLIKPPVGWAGTAILFRVSPTPGFGPVAATVLKTSANANVSLTVAANAWAVIPFEVFGFMGVALQAAAEGVDRTLQVALTRRFCHWRPITLPIPSGATASQPVAADGATGGNIIVPAGLTGATLGFEVSGDAVTWTSVLSQTITAGGTYAIPYLALTAPLFRVVAAGAQGAQRDIGGYLSLPG